MEIVLGLLLLVIYGIGVGVYKVAVFLIEVGAELLYGIGTGLKVLFSDWILPALPMLLKALGGLIAVYFGWLTTRFIGRVLVAPFNFTMLGKLHRDADQEFCLAVGLSPTFLDAHDMRGNPKTPRTSTDNISQVSDIFSLVFAIIAFAAMPVLCVICAT